MVLFLPVIKKKKKRYDVSAANTPQQCLHQKKELFHLSNCEDNLACLYRIDKSTVQTLVFFLLFLTVPSPFPKILCLLPVICQLFELQVACPLCLSQDAFPLLLQLLCLFLDFLTSLCLPSATIFLHTKIPFLL